MKIKSLPLIKISLETCVQPKLKIMNQTMITEIMKLTKMKCKLMKNEHVKKWRMLQNGNHII